MSMTLRFRLFLASHLSMGRVMVEKRRPCQLKISSELYINLEATCMAKYRTVWKTMVLEDTAAILVNSAPAQSCVSERQAKVVRGSKRGN